MKTVCASSMPFAREAFETLGEVDVREGRTIERADIIDAQLLATRSTTKLSRELIEDTPVRFIGTATIGTDHMDTPYMEQVGIHWCHAPGCNANSVAEYVVSALLSLAVKHGFELSGKTIGIIGVGNVGTRVAEKAAALGLRILLNDPPRQRTESENAHPFVSIDQLLTESDIVTTHVPLTREGIDATFHLADQKFFEQMRPESIFINAARGAVVDTPALLQARTSGHIAHAVIDTWEGEPSIPLDLLDAVDIATPHIAGHSFEGKVMGTVMVYQEACRFLETPPTWDHAPCMPEPPVPSIETDATGKADQDILWDVVRRIYDINADDRVLRDLPSRTPEDVAKHFDSLRGAYPMRREFRYTRVHIPNATPALVTTLRDLEFQI
jgi:erythronate-4-phosphate dehydrogenase